MSVCLYFVSETAPYVFGHPGIFWLEKTIYIGQKFEKFVKSFNKMWRKTQYKPKKMP
jgi:hypothetical protein